MTIKQIENIWRESFKKSTLITDGYFNHKIARQLYYGTDKDSDLPFKEGFQDFYDNCYISDTENNLDSLLQYLHFIGITISKKSIKDGIARGTISYQSILKKAFYIFKHLASYDEDLNIDNPYQDNMGDLFFFLKIEEGDNGQPKQLTLFDELELPDFYNKYIELPTGYENNKTAQKLFDLIENSDKSIFLTGKAGTGKSTFIHYFTKQTNKSVLLVAFTGIAAINIGGQTIHSFFRFPLKPLLPNDPDITIFKPFFQKRKILEQTDTIIIDEVSMLRSDILEGLDYSLRMNGGNPNKIFGGKQLILVGDIFQLPPVIDNADEVESELFKIIYDSEYFFDSIAYKQLDPEIFEFNKVHRQSNEGFLSLLNKVRDCSIDNNGINELNKRYNPRFTSKPEEFAITLTTNNYLAKTENVTKLNSLPYKNHFFKANITGDFKEDKYPTDLVLELRRNSQIMLVKNDSIDKGRRWVNGTIAKIDFIDEVKIEIRLKDGAVYTLQKEIWENRQYQWDKNKGRITSKIIGTFEQYPIKLAWAITIHKSQGLTFDNVIIDLGSGAFVNGQLYTALSRCRTLEGLKLKRRIQKKDAIEDKRLIHFYNNKIKNSSIKLENDEGSSVEFANNVNWIFLLKNFSFFNQLFSTHYHFAENELKDLHAILSIGSPYLTLDSGAIHSLTTFGLIYNNHIEWSEALKELYYEEPRLLYAGGSSDEYGYNIEFDALPLSIYDEFESIKSIAFEKLLSGHEDPHEHNLDECYNEILAKTKFSDKELYDIVANRVFEYNGNTHYYLAWIELLKKGILDFSVINYYKKYKNNSKINLKELFSKNDYLLLRLLSVHYPFTNEFLNLNSNLVKTGNCIYSDGFDHGAELISSAKYGLCFNCNIDKDIFKTSNLKFEVDTLNNYDLTGFSYPNELPLDIEKEKKCAREKISSFISELEYLNQDFFSYIAQKDELDDEDSLMISEFEKQKEDSWRELDFIDANFEIIDLEGLNSIVQSSSQYLAINSDFYNKLICFLNTNYPKWFTNLFDK